MRSLLSPPLALLLVLPLALCVPAAPGQAKVFLTVDEALALAYPGCEVERSTVFLDEAQLDEARRLASVEVETGLVYPYQALCDGEAAGTAYFDSHRVRTLPETVMVAIDAEGKVIRVEVLAFREPEDYIPREIWYRQFAGEALDDELDLKREIRGVTGATLTVRATTEAVRRVLAIHQLLEKQSLEKQSLEKQSLEKQSLEKQSLEKADATAEPIENPSENPSE